MKKILVRIIVTALALWLTTLIIGSFAEKVVYVDPYGSGGVVEIVLTYLLVAVIFGVVNGVIGNFVRIVAFPLYVLTLGLLALVVNSLLLLLVSWISTQIGFGLQIESFWWGVLAAVILGFVSWILSLFARPIAKDDRKRR